MSYYDYNENRGGFMSQVPQAVKSIIIINVLVAIMTFLNKGLMSKWFALDPIYFVYKPWQLVTYMFMHGDFFHLFFNMYTLFIFGGVLERVWGTKKFLFYYFVTGIGAALIHIGLQWLTGYFALTVGASGAIYGLLLGYAMLEGKVVRTDICGHRTFARNYRNTGECRSFRSPWRSSCRTYSDDDLEEVR